MSSKLMIAAWTIATLALPSPAALAQEGMTVVRDAESGKLRAPTAAELRALQAKDPQRQQQLAKPRPQSALRPDGTRALELGERGLVYSVATRDADGKVTRRCVKGHRAGEQNHDHE
ncbi:MAG: hypothetical protein Q7S67_00755 [Telluria sp.]|nr:hypothetical protein [Telluria sp.]